MSEKSAEATPVVGYQPRIVLESSEDGSFKLDRGKVFDDQKAAETALGKFKAPKGFKIRADLSRIVADVRIAA